LKLPKRGRSHYVMSCCLNFVIKCGVIYHLHDEPAWLSVPVVC
jgi:hypothetical protein